MAYQRKFARSRIGDPKLDKILQEIYDDLTYLIGAEAGAAIGDMLKSAYDTDNDGKVESADAAASATEADKVDGKHAADFADASHDHAAADITSGTLDGDRLPAISTSKGGAVPATGTPSGKFLKDSGAWDTLPSVGYALSLTSLNLASPINEHNYYLGNTGLAPVDMTGSARVYVPKAGTIKAAYIRAHCGTAGSLNEDVSVYIRKNDTTDYLIQTAPLQGAQNEWHNTGLSVAVSAGDYFEIKIVCPAWATTPANVRLSGSVYIE